MKYFFILLFTLFSLTTFAQNPCGSTHTLFNPPRSRQPQDIHHLGTYPQMKFLQNVTTKNAFFSAIVKYRHEEKYADDFNELDNLLKQIKFANGLDDADFNVNNITYVTVPNNTIGMLGYKEDNRIGYQYSKLIPADHKGFKGWKITSPAGCSFYIFTICGNAFSPNDPL